MRNPANPSSVRINNQELIIEYLRASGPTSRAGLSKALSISKPTVSTNVDALLALDILIEKGNGSSSGGRIPTLVAFNDAFKCILTMDLNRNAPLIALCDLSGNILDSNSVDVSIEDDKPVIIEKITSSMNKLIIINKFKLADLGVISIAIPGVIDEDTGKIFANPQFNLWTKLNLKHMLSEIYHVPVTMKNDISMAALGEKHYGCGQEFEDIAYVSAGLGVGAGLILNNKLFEGKRKAAGEIGYSKFCSNQDNLEAHISTLKLFENIKKDIENGTKSILSKWLKDEEISIELVNRALENKDEYVLKIIRDMGRVLGTAVANMALILDLELIVIGGVIAEFGDVLLNEVKIVNKEILPFETHINYSSLGSMAGTYGLMYLGQEVIMKGMVV